MKNALCLMVCAAASMHASFLYAQSGERPEKSTLIIGGHFTDLGFQRFQKFGRYRYQGLGGRMTYHFSPAVAIEAETNFFPDFFEQKIQGLFGTKIGFAGKRIGLFGKARPGFLIIRDRLLCGIPEGCAIPDLPARHDQKNHFTLDAGAVIEVYNIGPMQLRFDFGDTLTRFVRSFTEQVGDGPIVRHQSKYVTHSPQFSMGVGFRF